MSIEAVWYDVARKTREQVLGPFAACVRDEHWSDSLAQPGYVGKNCVSGGILLIALNPANGGDDYDHVHRAIELFSTDQSQFAALNNILEQEMPTWRVMKTAGSWAMQNAGVDFCEVSFTNLLKWRSDDRRSALFERSWPDCQRQIDALAPGLVVVLGKGTAEYFSKYYRGPARTAIVARTNGDRGLAPQSIAAASALADYRQRSRA